MSRETFITDDSGEIQFQSLDMKLGASQIEDTDAEVSFDAQNLDTFAIPSPAKLGPLTASLIVFGALAARYWGGRRAPESEPSPTEETDTGEADIALIGTPLGTPPKAPKSKDPEPGRRNIHKIMTTRVIDHKGQPKVKKPQAASEPSLSDVHAEAS